MVKISHEYSEPLLEMTITHAVAEKCDCHCFFQIMKIKADFCIDPCFLFSCSDHFCDKSCDHLRAALKGYSFTSVYG